MRIHYASLALLLFSASATAAPVYLDCSVSSGTETQRFSVTLDEATNKITHTGDTGTAFNADGFFSVDEISYKSIAYIPPGLHFTRQYTINRVNLAATLLVRIEAVEKRFGIAPTNMTSQGSCKVVQAPERQI